MPTSQTSKTEEQGQATSRMPEGGRLDLSGKHDLATVLRRHHLRFADNVSEEDQQSLRDFWDELRAKSGDNLSSADVDEVLRTYLGMEVLERVHGAGAAGASNAVDASAEQALGTIMLMAIPRGMPATALAQLLVSGFAGSDSFARISDAIRHKNEEFSASLNSPVNPKLIRELEGTQSPVAQEFEQVYGGFAREGDSLLFEFKDRDGILHALPVTYLDLRFRKLLTRLAQRHVAIYLVGHLAGSKTGTEGVQVDAPTLAATVDARGTEGDLLLEVTNLHAAEDVPDSDSYRSMSPGLLKTMVERLRTATVQPRREAKELPAPPLTRRDEIAEYLACMEDTLPENIRSWAYQNLRLLKDETTGKDERRHATRALSLMLSVQWRSSYFKEVDPVAARKILDDELYGLDAVKQRVIETIIQINRTHTLPFYGLLLVGPAGTGKSQIAYAVAKILKLPWAVLDMSSIRDSSALTGSARIYSNAKPGRIMDAFVHAGSSNMVFVINELDKADAGSANGSSADALLTLFDNLGFTDNYIECAIPTSGVYPIATANDISKISGPLLSRFAVIKIDDYTPEEKRTIFLEYSMPKILRHLGMRGEEFELTDRAVDCIIDHFKDVPGCRELEQAAEHLAAHALYELEATGASHVTFDEANVCDVLALT